MLIKKELLTIPVAPPPKADKRSSYTASASVVKLPKSGKILAVELFKGTLQLRFFSDGKGFILYLPNAKDSERWRTCKPTTALSSYMNITALQTTLELVHGFLKKKLPEWHHPYSVLDEIDRFAQSISGERSQKAAQAKYDLQQKHFAMFPPYPKGLTAFCERTAFPKAYLFFDRLVKGKRRTICGVCAHEFTIDHKVKHSEAGICPSCGKAVLYHQAWHQQSIRDKTTVCIANKHQGQLFIRYVNVARSYRDGKPTYTFDDYFRTLYLNNDGKPTVFSYKFMNAMYWGQGWYRLKNGSTCRDTAYVFPGNLRRVFGDRYYNVDLAVICRKSTAPLKFTPLLDNLKNIPQTEYLISMGLSRLASELRSGDFTPGKGLAESLGISKQYLPLYQKFNVSLAEHEVVKSSKTWVSEENFEKYKEIAGKQIYFHELCDLMNYISFQKFVTYFTKQKLLYPRENLQRLTGWYKDYIQMSDELQVDLSHKSVRYPKNIRKAHDLIVSRYNEVREQIETTNLKLAADSLYTAGMKDYADENYRIVLPAERKDFIREGQSLDHCVGNQSYFDNHMQGTRMIFFVRRANDPDTPFITMEVDMKRLKICQLYGYGDSTAPSAVRKFADKFVRKLGMPGTAVA